MKSLKENVQEINKAKDQFVSWLKAKEVELLDTREPERITPWDYYCVVSGFINDELIICYFMIWNGSLNIDYYSDSCRYKDMSVEKFLKLMD